MAARMRMQPTEPVEHSRIVTPPLMTQGAGRGSDERGAHMKLEPLAKFTGKGLSTVCDWVEKTENWLVDCNRWYQAGERRQQLVSCREGKDAGGSAC